MIPPPKNPKKGAVRMGAAVAIMNNTPTILAVFLDIFFPFLYEHA